MPNKEDLFHYGVPGMKWGVRKDRVKTSRASGYSDKDYAKDKRRFGNGGAKYVNKKISEGSTLADARNKAAKRQATQAKVAVGMTFVAAAAPTIMRVGINYAIDKQATNSRIRENNRDRADLMKDMMLTSYETIRLSQDPDGVWR